VFNGQPFIACASANATDTNAMKNKMRAFDPIF